MKREIALKIFNRVKDFYNQFGDEFSARRQTLWQELELLVREVKKGERVLDLGCGNGRLIELFKGKQIEYVGVDNSEKLLKIARQKYPGQKFILTSGLDLPFPDEYFDKIFCIAVLHHIPSYQLRLEFIQEAKRVLKKDGKIILTVWNLWQIKKSFLLFIKYSFLKVIGQSQLDFKDIFYPWQKDKQARYFHLFTQGELKKLFQKAGFIIENIGLLKRGKNVYNIYVKAKKA